jgi:predicted RNA binding protein YcfA (HicA-like mRNA interferase family)
MSKLEIMDHTGHTDKDWDKADQVSVKAAEARFNELTRKGYFAARQEPDGSHTQLQTFDPEAETIVLRPQLIGG